MSEPMSAFLDHIAAAPTSRETGLRSDGLARIGLDDAIPPEFSTFRLLVTPRGILLTKDVSF